jgi:hypothetical protein
MSVPPDLGTMEHPDGSVGTEPDDWATRSLDESARQRRAADQEASWSAPAWADADSAGGTAVLVALLLSVGRWLYHVIWRKGR